MPTSMNLFVDNQVVAELVGHGKEWRAPITTSEINFSLEKLGKRRWIFWTRPPIVHQLKVQEGVGYESIGYQLELQGGGQLNLLKVGLPQPEQTVEEGYGAFVRKVKRVEVKWQYLVWVGVCQDEVVVSESSDWQLKTHDTFDAFWSDVRDRVRKYRPVISAK